MRKNRPTKQHTAYHEAGHVVAHMALDLVTSSASICPGEGSLGEAVSPSVLGYECSGIREQRQIARAIMIGCYAGQEAEWIFDPNARDNSAEDDTNAFYLSRTYGIFPKAVAYVGDDAHQAYLRRLRAEARRLVRRHWPAVERVAAELLEKKNLSAEALSSLACELFPKETSAESE